MELKLNLDVITITYLPTKTIVFKCVDTNNDYDASMDELSWKIIDFSINEADRKFAEKNGCMYDGEINAEGFDDLHRFISYIEDCDFFRVDYKSTSIVV